MADRFDHLSLFIINVNIYTNNKYRKQMSLKRTAWMSILVYGMGNKKDCHPSKKLKVICIIQCTSQVP